MDEQVRRIPETRQLRHEFDDAEMADLGVKLSKRLSDLDQAKEEAKAVAAGHKAEQQAIETDIKALRSHVDEGYEMRDVKCERRVDFVADTVEVARLDTGEIIETRELKREERQLILEVGRQSALDVLDEATKHLSEEPPEETGKENGEPEGTC